MSSYSRKHFYRKAFGRAPLPTPIAIAGGGQAVRFKSSPQSGLRACRFHPSRKQPPFTHKFVIVNEGFRSEESCISLCSIGALCL